MQKTQIEKILNNVGINPTRQREKIFNYLAKYNTHPTADEIYQALISDGCNISRATVYNTLNKFKDKDIVRVVMIDKDVERFDLNFTEHAHFVVNAVIRFMMCIYLNLRFCLTLT